MPSEAVVKGLASETNIRYIISASAFVCKHLFKNRFGISFFAGITFNVICLLA